MEYELWVGTPHEMGRLAKGTLAQCKARAKHELMERRTMAEKFDRAALGSISECMSGVQGLTPLSVKKGPRTWTFPFIGINFRLEVRQP